MATSKTSILELNAHLMDLIQDFWDKDKAQIVVNAFAHLQPTHSKVTTRITQKQGGVFRGYTREAGDVSLANNKREAEETITGEDETQRARIGHFKVRRFQHRGSFSTIEFQHYWQVDLATQNLLEAPNPAYSIEYDDKTLEPYCLTITEWENYTPVFGSKDILKIPHLTIEFLLKALGLLVVEKIHWEGRRRVLYGTSRFFNVLY